MCMCIYYIYIYVYCNFMVCSASRKGQGSADQTKENSLRLNMYIYIYGNPPTYTYIYIYVYDIYIYIHTHVAMQQVEEYIKITVQLPVFLQQFATHFEQFAYILRQSQLKNLLDAADTPRLGPWSGGDTGGWDWSLKVLETFWTGLMLLFRCELDMDRTEYRLTVVL